MASCTTTRTYGNQSPARSASATAEPSCATRWSVRTPPTAPTPSSQTESAALSAPTPMVLHLHPPPHHQFCGFISSVAPPGCLPPHLWPSMALWPHMDWLEALSLPALPEDFSFRKNNRFWIYLLFISICILFLGILPALWRSLAMNM